MKKKIRKTKNKKNDLVDDDDDNSLFLKFKYKFK